MLKHRLITGPILILVVLGVIWADDHLQQVVLGGWWRTIFLGRTHPPGGLLILGLALGLVVLASLELSAMMRADGIMTRRWLTGLAAVFGLMLSYAIPQQTQAIDAIAIMASGFILTFVAALLIFSQDRNVRGVMAAAGAVVFAMVYLGLMLGFLLALRRGHSAWLIIGVVLTTKACDIGAYFTGRAIGRHKLIPWLSPGKTWEGLAGGIAASVLVGIALAWLSGLLPPGNRVSLPLGALCGVAFALVGQFGDLTMSLFKRGAGVKDASSILPGMGGVLDVLDSPLMVAPVAFWLLQTNGK